MAKKDSPVATTPPQPAATPAAPTTSLPPQAPAKKKRGDIAVCADLGTDGVRFTFADGKTLEASASQFSTNIQAELARFGLQRKLQNAFASPEKNMGSPEIARGLAQKVLDGLMADSWSARAPSAPKITVTLDALVAAVCAAAAEETGLQPDPAKVRKNLAALDAKRRLAVEQIPTVAFQIAKANAHITMTNLDLADLTT